MIKSFFKKKNVANSSEESVLIAALLIHAAKMDENYTIEEKKIIEQAMTKLTGKNSTEISEIIVSAEKKEAEENQIVNFTREIKKKDTDFRKKVIDILWKIILSDGKSDMYESNLMRRVCGLLYVSDRESGEIKLKNKI
mgnify:FL=1